MNNLKELFEIQAGLDAHILKNHPIQSGEDRLRKKQAALLVELGEMFNENRCFKFWSNNQKAKIKVVCKSCGSWGEIADRVCEDCDGKGERDLVLGELVDCLHFVLSIGLEHKFDEMLPLDIQPMQLYKTSRDRLIYQFIDVMKSDWDIYEEGEGGHYHEGLELFLGFCEMLGYSWEQITEAYMKKNQINHHRQINGY